MIIKVLCENTAINDSFVCEHGLSLYIETKKHRILFDMGQTTVFERNADAIEVDLSSVDIAFLSHGHYDHGGGLLRFLERNSKASVYVNENVFGEYYSDKEKYIGLDKRLKENNRLVLIGDELKIDDELSLYSCNGTIGGEKTEPFGLSMVVGGERVDDTFRHEHYLCIKESGRNVVISGCSHKGVVNITEALSPDVVVGGFHYSKIELDSDGREKLHRNADRLLESKATFYTGHCTGDEQYTYMKEIMKDRLHRISSGTVIVI